MLYICAWTFVTIFRRVQICLFQSSTGNGVVKKTFAAHGGKKLSHNLMNPLKFDVRAREAVEYVLQFSYDKCNRFQTFRLSSHAARFRNIGAQITATILGADGKKSRREISCAEMRRHL